MHPLRMVRDRSVRERSRGRLAVRGLAGAAATWLAVLGAGLVSAATLPFTRSFNCPGTHWISLPNVNPTINGSPVTTAEDLCALIPFAMSVSQAFGEDGGGGVSLAHEWTYDCAAHTCARTALSPNPPEAGCCSTCFCVNPGEGYRVTVSAASTFVVSGSESPDLIRPPGGTQGYLVSVPYGSCGINNANDLAGAIGLTSTGAIRGSVVRFNTCTNTTTSCSAGTAACTSLTLPPGEAFRVRYTNSLPHAYTYPVAGDRDNDTVANCADNCPSVVNSGQANTDGDLLGDACDDCPGAPDSAQVDADGDGRGDTCDNCPLSPNFGQTDADNDLRGDACDNCPANSNAGQSDVDRDGFGDACDVCAGGGSRNVAIVDSVSCINGGALPTTGTGPTGSLATYSYFTIPVGSVTAAQLGPSGACGASGCDTVLLNVCSAGMACTTAGLSAAEKADLNSFVGSGHKLIIYDSECAGVDFSWLAIPFTTTPSNAPVFSVVEENSLSSSQPADSHYIDTSKLGSNGCLNLSERANALETQSAGWCVDMRAGNSASGPVHLYATYATDVFATGLIIYNGLGLDRSCGDIPGTLTACQNFSKLWLQELQQPVNPACLPCEHHVVSCDDQNPCTDDVFNPYNGGCTHTPNFNPCDDGNACTLGDTCSFNVCYGGTPIACTASDACHVAGVCDPGTGLCSNPAAADGTPCADGDACTQTDTCQAGVCTGANPVTCTASDPCHVAGDCDPGNGLCSNPAAANGTSCNDGSACTQTDSCQGGTCTGANPVVCTASDPCHVAGVCDPGTGSCSDPAAADGTSCSDGNPCTQTDTCQAGTCTGANPVVCMPLDQCHVAGVCDTGTGMCSNPAAADGTPCDDGNACTQSESCQSGVCAPPKDVCNAVDDDCDGTIDEDCLTIVSGGGSIVIPGGKVTFGFTIWRPTEGAPISGGISMSDSVTKLFVSATLNGVQTLTVSGNTATFTGTCTRRIGFGSTAPCTFTATVVDGSPDSWGMTVTGPDVQYGPGALATGIIGFQ